jgi:uncharacterized protein (TIGR02594 family)
MDIELYAIQTRLKELGHDPGPLDGVWGKQTRDAIGKQLGITKAKQPDAAAVDMPWFSLAHSHVGVKEAPGAASNGQIVGFFTASVGQAHGDEVAWCAAFVGAMMHETGYKGTGSLMARSYLQWGAQLVKPRKGCVVVFKRGAAPAGHVGFVDDFTATQIRCLGGNQSNAVTIAPFKRADVLGYRWPNEAAA